MPPLKFFAKSFGIFIVVFIALAVLFSKKDLRQAHNSYYCVVAKPIFNIINPHIYTDFKASAPENDNNWDISFLIYDESKHGRDASRANYRKVTRADTALFQNHHDLILIPTLFLIALFIASPISWIKKLIRLPLSLLLFYVFMTMYLSYRFEHTVNGGTLAIDSLWHLIIWFFGLGGSTDPIYVVALFIWGILTIPLVIKTHFKSKIS